MILLVTESDVEVVSVQADHEPQLIQSIEVIIVMAVIHYVGRVTVSSVVVIAMVMVAMLIMCVVVAAALPLVVLMLRIVPRMISMVFPVRILMLFASVFALLAV